jgi:threonine 3-dehydrogenase
MNAIFNTSNEKGVEIRDNINAPTISDNEVLIKVKRAGICGTDLHIYNWDPWAQERMSHTIPLITGHEVSGIVVETGKHVSSVSLGDLVSAETHIACGKCYLCLTNRKAVCKNTAILGVDVNGVFADYAVLPEENAWVNDPNLPIDIAAILEPLGNAFHTVLPENNIEDIVGKKVLVTGAGPIGLLTIALCKQIGAEFVYASEINPTRISLAKKMGADLVINPLEDDLQKIIRDDTDGFGVDVFLEISGNKNALVSGLESVVHGGRVSLLGIFGNDEIAFDINNLLIFKGIRLFGIIGRRMFETWYQLKGLLKRSEFRQKVMQVITDTYKLDEYDQAIENILAGNSAKTILKINE